MIAFDDARKRILALARPAETEAVPLEFADGRVLAEDVHSDSPLPPSDYSAMDGYAVRTADFARGDAAWTLPVVGESRPGAPAPALVIGTAVRIFTGAPIPYGADTVVMQESVDLVDGHDSRATFRERPAPGRHIRRRGEDLPEGGLVQGRGVRVRPRHLGAIAAADRATVRVGRRPRVAIVATGDELRAPGEGRLPGTVPEGNSLAIAAMVRRAGGEIVSVVRVPDDVGRLDAALGGALAAADLVVTIGGVSVGDHDLVRPSLLRLGVTQEFWRVAIKPGRPFAVGTRGRAIVMGLPGNPVAAVVTFALFGVPLLRCMEGEADPFEEASHARLTHAYARRPGLLEFMRARATRRPDGLHVTPMANQASGAAVALASANALVRIAAECDGLAAGDVVEVIMLESCSV